MHQWNATRMQGDQNIWILYKFAQAQYLCKKLTGLLNAGVLSHQKWSKCMYLHNQNMLIGVSNWRQFRLNLVLDLQTLSLLKFDVII